MTCWEPIETAPKDKPIIVWHDHEADPETHDEGKTITAYCCWREAFGTHKETGLAIAVWIEGEWETDDMGGRQFKMPDAWFVDDGNNETPLNPVFWLPMPILPTGNTREGLNRDVSTETSHSRQKLSDGGVLAEATRVAVPSGLAPDYLGTVRHWTENT